MPKKNVMMIDPSLEYERMLSYKEKHGAWELYKTLFWSIYMLGVAVLLLKYVPTGMGVATLFGWSIVLLAIFTIVYGASVELHLKLMKRYG
jgi:hypothetical protein